MKEKVSVIIPVYRAEDTIARCVESLVEGTYSNLEVLLIDDCSPDHSWTTCLALQKKYPCVKVFHNEENSGVSATRNKGLQEMTGKYLMFVDSDDWVEPNFISTFVEMYEKYSPDLIVSGYMNHDEVQNAAIDYFGWNDTEEISVKSLKSELLFLYKGRLLQQIWNKFFLVDIVRKNELCFDTSIHMGEDFRFLLSYLECVSGDKLVQINKSLYHYIRCSGNSLMSQFGKEKIDEPLHNLERLYRLIGMNTDEIKQRLEQDHIEQIELWGYLIMHNMGMCLKEKKKIIMSLDAEKGKDLYRKNRMIYHKERLLVLAKRLGIHR